MASEWGSKNHNSSYPDKFQWNFDPGKRNLVRVNGEFELIGVRVNRVKMTEKWDEIQRKLNLVPDIRGSTITMTNISLTSFF